MRMDSPPAPDQIVEKDTVALFSSAAGHVTYVLDWMRPFCLEEGGVYLAEHSARQQPLGIHSRHRTKPHVGWAIVHINPDQRIPRCRKPTFFESRVPLFESRFYHITRRRHTVKLKIITPPARPYASHVALRTHGCRLSACQRTLNGLCGSRRCDYYV